MPPIWLCGEDGTLLKPTPFGSLTIDVQREVVHSRSYTIPDNWLVCDGIVMPSNYVDVAMFERIFETHNRYRVFLANSRTRDEEILKRMAQERGVMLDDLEARTICGNECKAIYGIRDPRRLAPQQRIAVAQVMRRKYRITIRQIAKLLRLPESEVVRYVP